MANIVPDFLQRPTHIGPITIPSVLPEQNTRDRMASDVLKDAGFPGSQIPTALGIIAAESGGRADQKSGGGPCSKQGDYAWGWFQVCTVNCGTAGTSRDKTKCIEQLKDPAINSKVALALWHSGGWGGPWKETYHPGITGKDFKVTGGTSASTTPTIDNPASLANAATGATGIDGIKDLISFISTPDSWLRIGKVALGFLIIALCLALFLFKLGVAPPPVKAATKIVRG